jgi:hypothetical protein
VLRVGCFHRLILYHTRSAGAISQECSFAVLISYILALLLSASILNSQSCLERGNVLHLSFSFSRVLHRAIVKAVEIETLLLEPASANRSWLCRNCLLGKKSVAPIQRAHLTNRRSGLAWHTDDSTLRAKFEEFGQVEEAVVLPTQPHGAHPHPGS